MTPGKLINLLIRSNKGHYLQRRPLRQSRALPEVTCMPIGLCACIYGTLGSHFEQFGFISPTQANCLSENGLVLCIQNATFCGIPNPLFTTTTATTPTTWGPWTPETTPTTTTTTTPTTTPTTTATTPTTSKPSCQTCQPSHQVNIIGPAPVYNMNSVITGPQVYYKKDRFGRTVFEKIIPGQAYWKKNEVVYNN
jgi:hypothetical protein